MNASGYQSPQYRVREFLILRVSMNESSSVLADVLDIAANRCGVHMKFLC